MFMSNLSNSFIVYFQQKPTNALDQFSYTVKTNRRKRTLFDGALRISVFTDTLHTDNASRGDILSAVW